MLTIILLITGCSDKERTACWEEFHIPGESGNNLEIDCCEACDSFNHEYLYAKYLPGGWGREGSLECYCNNNNEVERIY